MVSHTKGWDCCNHVFAKTNVHAKLSWIARERDHQRRAEFVDNIQQYDTAQLVSVDEAAVDARNMNRTFGWSYSGRCATIEVVYERGTRYDIAKCVDVVLTHLHRYSVLPAISLDGVIHTNIVQGSFNAIMFRHFISSLLDRMNPFPGTNSVILLDNASIHHSRETLDMIETRSVDFDGSFSRASL
jgi:DDE superfamily endonuclease